MRAGFDLVHRAAHELGNERELRGAGVRRRYRGVLEEIRTAAARAAPGGDLRASLEHFLKVTGSYEPGLFHCYDVPGLPRTNNDLEQLFGSTRHHERRCTGRKAASPGDSFFGLFTVRETGVAVISDARYGLSSAVSSSASRSAGSSHAS